MAYQYGGLRWTADGAFLSPSLCHIFLTMPCEKERKKKGIVFGDDDSDDGDDDESTNPTSASLPLSIHILHIFLLDRRYRARHFEG